MVESNDRKEVNRCISTRQFCWHMRLYTSAALRCRKVAEYGRSR